MEDGSVYFSAASDVYYSANQSPVSESSKSLENNLAELPWAFCEDQVSALEPANKGDEKQIPMAQQHPISRSSVERDLSRTATRSDTHLRHQTRAARPAIPKLNVKIPRSIASTNAKSPSVTPTSSTTSGMSTPGNTNSRIPIPLFAKQNSNLARGSGRPAAQANDVARPVADASKLQHCFASSVIPELEKITPQTKEVKEVASNVRRATQAVSVPNKPAPVFAVANHDAQQRQRNEQHTSTPPSYLGDCNHERTASDPLIDGNSATPVEPLQASPVGPRSYAAVLMGRSANPVLRVPVQQHGKIKVSPSMISQEAGKPGPNAEDLPSTSETYVSQRKDVEKSDAQQKQPPATIRSYAAVIAGLPSEDPIMQDSAIIYSRRSSISKANTRTFAQVADSALNAINEAQQCTPVSSGLLCPEQIRNDSTIVSGASSLRATAPEFVPPPSELLETETSLLRELTASPVDSCQPESQEPQLTGLEPTHYGFPHYHFWYRVPIECSISDSNSYNYQPSTAPWKKYRHNGSKRGSRGSKTVARTKSKKRSLIQTEEIVAMDQMGTCMDVSITNPSAITTEPIEGPALRRMTPFTEQLRKVMGPDPDGPSNKEPTRQIDWASIVNVPSRDTGTQSHGSVSSNCLTLPQRGKFGNNGRSKKGYYATNGLYDSRPGFHVTRNSRAALAGVPLNETAPFPAPAPPPVPQGSGHYFEGIMQRNMNGCGTFHILEAGEMIGGACNDCEADH
ncbi:hypothetical protein BU24DRAFT_427771 [Aaosphaeria arxii CBS 175.79]|uniref:Uncharacterized protein n=1 Tax=Aaosphaeria arxii CBS 175.79 TaxID=1450172 RepID=A0A6A5XC42_9PLEO|nr:uncharacterized protein BU24DRAFT_427771 [Aaosphaeria arxii CBS 175.79]KAF2010665.1 hypothetical protein BU24DRAFT_427771 [Aaosphaeria arxii CBS 175.79]